MGPGVIPTLPCAVSERASPHAVAASGPAVVRRSSLRGEDEPAVAQGALR